MGLLVGVFVCVLFQEEGGGMIRLPEPEFTDKSVEQCIENRRSVRSYAPDALTLKEISNILWAAQGVTDEEQGFRAVPSAGATYPLFLYFATEDGLFKYIPESHGIKKLKSKDLRKAIAHAALDQMFIADAGMVIVIAAKFENTTWRYGERGIRYVYIEAGHCAQNIHLEAVALGLGSVPIGAYHDDKVKELIGLEDEEDVVYIIPVGRVTKQ